jgi:hypothetical protein
MKPMDKLGKWAEKVDELERDCGTHLRRGQIFMVALAQVDEQAYEKITTTKNDCFYDDTKCKDFLNAMIDIFFFSE